MYFNHKVMITWYEKECKNKLLWKNLLCVLGVLDKYDKWFVTPKKKVVDIIGRAVG